MQRTKIMTFKIMRFFLLFITIVASNFTLTTPTSAEVRFGKNVRIGGHDMSHQRFNKNRRGKFFIYNTRPSNAGCRGRMNGDGSRTKICHLMRKRTR
jgi:hypothetical protein